MQSSVPLARRVSIAMLKPLDEGEGRTKPTKCVFSIRRTHYLLHHYDIIKYPYTIRGSPKRSPKVIPPHDQHIMCFASWHLAYPSKARGHYYN